LSADLLEAAQRAGAWRHILVLLGAGLVTGAGQIVLRHLSSGNGIDTTTAIWFHAGRMPALRTLVFPWHSSLAPALRKLTVTLPVRPS
jgi:chloride channel protein, CIC family